MSTNIINTKRRADYQAPLYLISDIELSFNLDPQLTRVKCISHVFKQQAHDLPLTLDGEQLTLVEVKVNGKPYSDYQQTETNLIISNLPDECYLEIYNEISPAENSSLEGLYYASDAFCSQCEAEGFRKITYFLDRPDVLSEYTVTIYADKKLYPYLLSNGNKIDSGDVDDAIHWVKWHDPFKKPCYLFALVAGDFDLVEDEFETKSNRKIQLELYVNKGKAGRGQHSLDSLKKAMKWDEDVFGLEYDLDIYMIVAVDFFNMGAMENKGLNVFNSKFVLADSDTATDEDYFNIESVIAHEYFHNWTGNRVTCRDWFQLSLKEGLTVFRDQQFSSDMTSPVVNRIKNVKVMREHQFAEDASSMSHPIRPDEVIEMNNFYTVTVYDKGAEVIRMMHTLLGADGFRKGMNLYFERHDGSAVTCDDFVNAMQDANTYDLSTFKRWYGQSGTPVIKVVEAYDADNERYQLDLEQINLPTADQAEKQDLHIPINIELLNKNVSSKNSDIKLVNLVEQKQSIILENVAEKPTASLLANFSAPVKLQFDQSSDELIEIALGSQDGFSRWDAIQKLLSQYIHQQTPISPNELSTQVNEEDIDRLLTGLLTSPVDDLSLQSEMVTLPSIETLAQQVSTFWVTELYSARQSLLIKIATNYQQQWSEIYNQQPKVTYQYDLGQIGQRKLKNTALQYLSMAGDGSDLIKEQYKRADNMTDSLGALKAAQQGEVTLFDEIMLDFEQTWQSDPLVLDKWFALHASTTRTDILSRMDLLKNHKQYTISNPNRVRSLMGTFSYFNTLGFHAKDGSGYRYLTDYLMELDQINPQVSARIITPLTQWQRLDESRQSLIKLQLARLLEKTDLSKDLLEKVTKSLNFH